MKRKVLLSILALIAMTALLMGFAACDSGNQHVHRYGEWEQTTAPTCTAEGEKTRVCKFEF